jgi:hypothetical protein
MMTELRKKERSLVNYLNLISLYLYSMFTLKFLTMKQIQYFLAVVLLCFAHSTMAQKPGKFFSFGFGFEGGIPQNYASTLYKFTLGGSVRFSLHAGPGFATISAGGNVFVPYEISGQGTKVALQIPVEAGYKYIFLRHFFLMGELGYSWFRYYSEGTDNNLVINRTGGISYGPSLGVQLGSLELRLKYETMVLNSGNLNDLRLRLGFNF